MKLNNFLNPKQVAILGASSDKKKIGRIILDNVLLNKKVKIFPINLKEKKIAGVKTYSDLSLLPLEDFSQLLLVISIPARFVLDEIIKASKLGVKNVIIISAGFKEIGLEGAEMEKKISEIAKQKKMNILGPNCLGFININNNHNVSFSDYSPDKKIKRQNNVAFLSQSGAIGSAVLNWLENKNIGLSCFVSLGNKSNLNENDFFEFFYQDKRTDLIIAYLEEISEGDRFLEIVSKISQIKPVAILKAGRTTAGSEMAMSHTGSLAGSNQAAITALKRSGTIILENISQIYNLMRLIKEPLSLSSDNLAIISNAGGPTVLASDEVFENGLNLNNFSSKTIKDLKNNLPKFAHIKNPLDILGDADSLRYKNNLEIVLKDPKISAVLVLLTLQSMTDVDNIALAISALKNKYKNKLICTCFLGGRGLSGAKKILADNLIANFDSVEEAISVLAKVLKYYSKRKEIKIYKKTFKSKKDLISKNEVLDYVDSFKLFKKQSLNVIKTEKIDYNNFKKIKYPAVIKFVGPDFIHKSDRGAIFLNVKNFLEAKTVLDKINKDIKTKKISNKNYAVYQPMTAYNFELILGLKRDPVFGPLIMFGLGGIYAEIYKDVSFELSDLNRARAIKMVEGIKAFEILNGARGRQAMDFNKLVDIILKLAKIVNENPEFNEIDLNPLLVTDKEIKIADIRIVV
ncbi:MAG: acetate--CoA ligase family protein [Patescibacteria group bacterium]|nr:acetate--CoA ligase family protein [Patescibacteria group bacterium]